MCIPDVSTASAHRKSASVARCEFSSTNRTSHDAGRYAAMTSRPWGGMNARTRPPKNGYACWNVPNDFAYSGNTHRIRRPRDGAYGVRMIFWGAV